MHGAGHYLLTCAALTGDQDGRVRARDAIDQVTDFFEGRARADQLVVSIAGAALGTEARDLLV